LNSYIELLAAQVGCLTHQRISSIHAEGQALPNTHFLFTPRKAFPLGSRSPLWLTVAQTVHLSSESMSGRWRVETIGYFYRIGIGDEGSQEILAYHYDPFNQESGSRAPHLHVGRAAYRPLGSGYLQDFHKRHIPTGHVTFPMVARFLIGELDVTPVNRNWASVLTDAEPS
jgi:hypothetical protein